MAAYPIVLLGLGLMCVLTHFVFSKHGIRTFSQKNSVNINVIAGGETSSTAKTNFRPTERNISRGCTAPLLLPNKPFVAIWNLPSVGCEMKHQAINFNNSGITVNTNDSYYGEELVLFLPGKFPIIAANGTMINGGIPQLGDLAGHLAQVTADVARLIPDVGFKGVGIMDFEYWRPIWDTDWDSMNIYRVKSMDLVRQQHPTWNKTQILQEATNQFETAAKAFLLGTLDKVRQLRTSGYFGYYKYPRCWGQTNTTAITCNQKYTLLFNDKMSWIFRASSAFFPRNYFYADEVDYATAYSYIRRTLNETLRVQAKYSGLDTPIIPYVDVFQKGLNFLNKTDLALAIREPADMGASGVVVWGISTMFRHPGICGLLSRYIQDILGPYITETQKFFEKCSQQNCNSHGRCVRKDYAQITEQNWVDKDRSSCQHDIHDSSTVSNDNEFAASYICRCFQGWKGQNCSFSF